MGAVMLRERNWGKLRWLAVPLAAALLTGCGDSAEQADTSGGVTGTTLSGSVFASYVDGASCNVLDINGNVIAGPFTTSASGGYNVALPDSHLAENLVVECTGGTFIDEATGLPQTAGTMSAFIAGGTASVGTSVHVTPSTTIINELVSRHDMSAADAIAAFVAAFGFTPDFSVAPTDATSPEAGVSIERLLAGLRAAIFSQLAADLGQDQFALLTALVDDLADGTLDGDGTLPADIRNLFNQALVNFRNGNDATGLANSQLGVLPFAKVATTANYRMTYVEGMHSAINGKTAFSINVANLSDSTPATGLAVSIEPEMQMDGRVHSTPYEASCNEMGTGEYHCTVYYVMPSVMGMGEMAMSMGYWQLAVTAGERKTVGAETANFYPAVTMAMGDTAQVRMTARKGDGDNVMAMGGVMEERTYYLFKEGLSGGTGNHDLELFIATRESMVSFPAITTLLDVPATKSFGSILVSVSTDGGGEWFDLTPGAAGHWSITGLTGLENGVQATVLVKLTVDDLPKVANDVEHAVFTLTPGGGMMPMPM